MSGTMSLGDIQVLLVEPSPTQQHLIERMLKQTGVHMVRCCAGAGEALAAMRETRPGAVVSSLYLPDMAGTELVAAMRADADLEEVPFVLVSSETRPQVLDPIRQAGACCILAKPFTEKQLGRALHAVLDYLNPAAVLTNVDVENLRVLVVDDSKATRRHIGRLLADLGIENVIEAENGVVAVATLAETMVDLVLTDYNMPEMDGRALTEYIRTQSWQNSVPILMITSEQDVGRLAAVEKAGVSAICDKPFEASGIRRIITEALAG
jgi:two-component system, chemotaxis family, chemotaxis protein CheY